ncbi:MAG: hypothetical protein KDD33_10985 [Bdellovibrionales bacterium]|nr:hypothetical protein [Bdellovibrionales bacterium]
MFHSKRLISAFMLIPLSIFAISCSDKSFSAKPSDNVGPSQCNDGQNCDYDLYDYTKDAVAPKADILFVVDNSGSMSPEQREMGNKFPSFLSSLGDLDYRIAITTTDIADGDNPPSSINQWGALQDGRLIAFPNGAAYLDGSLGVATEQSHFLNTVRRQETINCENSGYNLDLCPSGDERGLLAANMTITSNYNNFIRPDGHLAIVFLSDEDERSDGNETFTAVEYPNNFVTVFQSIYPNKSLKAHSIIIRPGDSGCLYDQSINSPRGFFGDTYAELSNLTGGIIGDICASDYSGQLSDIGEDVAQPREILPCRPYQDEVTVTFEPQPSYNVEVTKNLEQKEILFSRSLPRGTKIRFQFRCLK